jgi:hypothetical protein
MVARMAAASKCRKKKCKKPEKPILAEDPEETSPPFVPLYPLLQGKASGADWVNTVHHPNA